MKKPLIVFTTAALILVSACATPTSKQTGGAVIGGLAGGVLGSQVGKGKGRDAAMDFDDPLEKFLCEALDF